MADCLLIEYLENEIQGQYHFAQVLDSLGHGWTEDYLTRVVKLPVAQLEAMMTRIQRILLDEFLALWVVFEPADFHRSPMHLIGAEWNDPNEGSF